MKPSSSLLQAYDSGLAIQSLSFPGLSDWFRDSTEANEIWEELCSGASSRNHGIRREELDEEHTNMEENDLSNAEENRVLSDIV